MIVATVFSLYHSTVTTMSKLSVFPGSSLGLASTQFQVHLVMMPDFRSMQNRFVSRVILHQETSILQEYRQLDKLIYYFDCPSSEALLTTGPSSSCSPIASGSSLYSIAQARPQTSSSSSADVVPKVFLPWIAEVDLVMTTTTWSQISTQHDNGCVFETHCPQQDTSDDSQNPTTDKPLLVDLCTQTSKMPVIPLLASIGAMVSVRKRASHITTTSEPAALESVLDSGDCLRIFGSEQGSPLFLERTMKRFTWSNVYAC